jgi:glutamate racemase
MTSSAQLRPIGLFDSGIGGLTVLDELQRLLPRESTIYFGDTARVPYGNKSEATVRRFAVEAAELLMQHGIKFLVLACNTVSATALELLRERLPIPVVGVIEPGARAAVSRTRGGHIGVIGTSATIESGAYQKAIAAIRPDASVVAHACPLFVPLVEEGWTRHQVAEEVARIYLAPLKSARIDSLVLGCTHYPLLTDILARVMGPEVSLVSSATEVARLVRSELERLDLRSAAAHPARRVLVSDSPERFARVARNFMGEELGTVELVPLPQDGPGAG